MQLLILSLLFQILLFSSASHGLFPSNSKSKEDILPIDDISKTTITFPDIVKNEIIVLDENITLQRWHENHSQDVVTTYIPSDFERPNDNWCLCAVKRFVLPSSQIVVRRAFFYAPLPPNNLELPSLKDSLYVKNNTAILGMISVEMIERSQQYGGITADEVIEKLSSVLGPGDKKRELWGYGSSSWSHTCRWENGNKIFASAYGIQNEDNRAPMVAVYGFLPISEFHVDDIDDYKELSVGGLEINSDSILFQRSIRYLSQYQREAASLLKLYYRNEKDSLDLKTTATMFTDWINLFRNANRSERARSLIFADMVFKRIEGTFLKKYMWELDKLFVTQMQSIGAQLAQGRTEGYVYERSWLKQANALSPKDTVGDLALLIMMQKGFQLEADCHDCGQCFNRIILEGENYLIRSQDKMFSSWVHLILGYAYNDVYCISNGYPTMSTEDTSYPIIDGKYARLKSIEHFATVFQSDKESKDAREAWRCAWRVIAGIQSKRLMYTCVDE
jgi:hypothetical protein